MTFVKYSDLKILVFFMSLVANRFGYVEFKIFFADVKIKTNLRNSTLTNRWATKDFRQLIRLRKPLPLRNVLKAVLGPHRYKYRWSTRTFQAIILVTATTGPNPFLNRIYFLYELLTTYFYKIRNFMNSSTNQNEPCYFLFSK